MKCKLCLKEVPLIKKSHIIPDFMYKGLFDEKHFTALVKLDEMKIVSKKPDGIYDKRILCAKCDNEIIGAYETYASKILFGGNFSKKLKPKYKVSEEPRGTRVEVENIDYKKFKLFLISIIWRGHISNNEFFKEINLGKYAEIAREMILNGNPLDENDFETMIFFYEKNFTLTKSLVPSRKFRMEGNICYSIHIQGVSIVYRISKGTELEYFEIGKMRKNNTTNFHLPKGKLAKQLFNKITGIKV